MCNTELAEVEEGVLTAGNPAPDALLALRGDVLWAMYASVRERGDIRSPEVEATLQEIRMVKAMQASDSAATRVGRASGPKSVGGTV